MKAKYGFYTVRKLMDDTWIAWAALEKLTGSNPITEPAEPCHFHLASSRDEAVDTVLDEMQNSYGIRRWFRQSSDLRIVEEMRGITKLEIFWMGMRNAARRLRKTARFTATMGEAFQKELDAIQQQTACFLQHTLPHGRAQVGNDDQAASGGAALAGIAPAPDLTPARAKEILKAKGWSYRQAAPVLGIKHYQSLFKILNVAGYTNKRVLHAIEKLPRRAA